MHLAHSVSWETRQENMYHTAGSSLSGQLPHQTSKEQINYMPINLQCGGLERNFKGGRQFTDTRQLIGYSCILRLCGEFEVTFLDSYRRANLFVIAVWYMII